tara:strand:- start:208 stop:639 length:432 start_codon:yes stop_codon:yes gene_type:complete
MKKIIITSLIALAGILNAKTQIEFQQLEYLAEPHDLIEIQEVNLIDTEELIIGSTIEVIGRYNLGSTDNAQIGLSITSKEKGGKHYPQPYEQKNITKGSGEFRLVRKIDRNGGIHISIYPQAESGRYEQSSSRLYFLELNQGL